MDRRASDAEAELKARAKSIWSASKRGSRGNSAGTARPEVPRRNSRNAWPQRGSSGRPRKLRALWRPSKSGAPTRSSSGPRLEAKLADSYREKLARRRSGHERQGGPQSGAVDPVAIERAVAEARAMWEIEEGARRAKDAAELAAAHQRHVAQLEAQHAALTRCGWRTAQTAWRKAEDERLAAAETGLEQARSRTGHRRRSEMAQRA